MLFGSFYKPTGACLTGVVFAWGAKAKEGTFNFSPEATFGVKGAGSAGPNNP